MGIFNDVARPRFFAVDPDYRVEVDYVPADEITGAPEHVSPIDLVDSDGQSVDNDELFELAAALTAYDGECVEDALDALLGFALELDRADRVVTTADLWELCFGSDPETREVWLTSEDVDAFAQEHAQ